MAGPLEALLRVSSVINSTRGLEALEEGLLAAVMEFVPADRGAVLMVGETPQEITSMFGLDRRGGSDRPMPDSRAIIDRVLREGTPMLSNGDAAGLETNAAVLAVPLVAFQRVRGVLYLDAAPPAWFDEQQRDLLMAIGGIAATALENARRLQLLEIDNRSLREEIRGDRTIIGQSPRMQEVYQVIARVAPTDATVLICGESGTGKELAARAIHEASPRRMRPFVAINCAALPEALLESELFGYEKGAFTGALNRKRGKLEVADGGTVFLDEVTDLAPALQSKLLRVLQEREFERVGGTETIHVDLRWLSATNRDLMEVLRQKTLRQDLYYRLNVVGLEMPPLRERREDIPLLVQHFVTRHAGQCKRRVVGLSDQARRLVSAYDWPGNVRELENAIERAVVLGSSEVVLPEDLPESLLETAPAVGEAAAEYHEAVRRHKGRLILEAVERAGGHYTEAARLLGLHPNYLHRLIRNLNLRPVLKRIEHLTADR